MRFHIFLVALLATLPTAFLSATVFASTPASEEKPFVIIVQPIIVQGDDGTDPASMALPEDLVDRAYDKANIDFYFLEPLHYNNSAARDGEINLDQIVLQAKQDGMLRGQGDIVNMFFVNAVDGQKGPLGRGMFNGDLTFITLGKDGDSPAQKAMQAFVIAHEVGHNLGLPHAVDDPSVPDDLPNIQGDGAYEDRIDPRHSLTPSQIEKIMQSPLVHPRVDLLSRADGQEAILDESFEPYFSKLQKREIEAFVAETAPDGSLESIRDFARQKFTSAVLDFTPKEKQALVWLTQEVRRELTKHNIGLMAGHPWRFIKVDSWLCGGFAHTRGTYIILSQHHMDSLRTRWSGEMTKEVREALLKGFGALLVHEQMHSLQRSFPEKFARLNQTSWGFHKAHVEPEEYITLNQVSNPDAPQAEWLIPDPGKDNQYYWIRTLLKPTDAVPRMGEDFTDQVFTVTLQDNKYRVKKDRNSVPKSFPVTDFSWFTDQFPVSRGIDHPNEIAAYMFAEKFKTYVASRKSEDMSNDPKSMEKTNNFLLWVNQQMSYQHK
ncbi:hypothetical protein [Paremcibacter congregatus]|uniref:hypothetical protein n=1 Tax=Paremcibacter congregatus TaxID=2043170 RepID=UPI003A8FDE55